MNPDARALKILFETYWSSFGWRMAGQTDWAPTTPADDLAYAIRAGVMFPPRVVTHDDAMAWIVALRDRMQPRDVGAAFLATLSNGAPALRSALGSYAVARHMPVHRYAPNRFGMCTICGGDDRHDAQDLNVLSFERHKWGGVRHDDPVYIAFDLERFQAEADATPSAGDQAILAAILASVESMPVGARLADLVKAIRIAVGGNVHQRRALIGLLGFAAILAIPGRTGYLREFTPVDQREDTPWYKDDWPYPARWWRGGHGVDREAVAFWFGDAHGTVRAAP